MRMGWRGVMPGRCVAGPFVSQNNFVDLPKPGGRTQIFVFLSAVCVPTVTRRAGGNDGQCTGRPFWIKYESPGKCRDFRGMRRCVNREGRQQNG